MAWAGYEPDEWAELEEAVRRNCVCEFTDSILDKRCAPCEMLYEKDARALNGLLFLRRVHASCSIFSEELIAKE